MIKVNVITENLNRDSLLAFPSQIDILKCPIWPQVMSSATANLKNEDEHNITLQITDNIRLTVMNTQIFEYKQTFE